MNSTVLVGRVFWNGAGWYASRVEGDSNMEVALPLECDNTSVRLPTQDQMMEARQKGLGSPFYLVSPPPGFEVIHESLSGCRDARSEIYLAIKNLAASVEDFGGVHVHSAVQGEVYRIDTLPAMYVRLNRDGGVTWVS